MLGFEPGELPTREQTFFQRLHPDDVPLVSAALRAHFQDHVPYSVEIRLRRKDDSHAWILARGQAERNPQGEVRTMAGTHVDLSTFKAAQEAMQQARDAALEASRLKSAFVANVSHEIRTPMNGIIGLTHLLLGTPLSQEQRDYAGLLKTSADALMGILNDVLDFSKIESGRLLVEQTCVSVDAVVAEVIAVTAGLATTQGLVLNTTFSESPLLVRADALRLRQVLLNLLGNAIKFTAQGHICVHGRRTEHDTVRVEVADTGIGVAPEAILHLFQPFQQADGSMTRRYGGTGLGLAICQQLVQLMSGSIGFSPRPGGGSVFWLELPVWRVAATASHVRRVCTLDADVIELRLLHAVMKGADIQQLEHLEDLAKVQPPADLLIVAGQAIKPDQLAAAVQALPVHEQPEVIVRTSDSALARSFAAHGFRQSVASVRLLRANT